MRSQYFFAWAAIVMKVVFVKAQVVCPQAGLVDEMDQNTAIARKCYYVMKYKPIVGEHSGQVAKEACKTAGGPSAKIAQPNDAYENEILRQVLEEWVSSSENDVKGNNVTAYIGTIVNRITEDDGGTIVFEVSNKIANNIYNLNYLYQERYEKDVGEVGSVFDEYYSYFLQSDKYRSVLKVQLSVLCVGMNSGKGNWELGDCTNLAAYGFSNVVLCESPIFKECKFEVTKCAYDSTINACTQTLSKNCPPLIPTVVYCESSSCIIPCLYSEWSDFSGCAGDCKSGRINKRFRAPLVPYKDCQNDFESTSCNERCSGCKVGEWTEWSNCSAPCGVGSQIRTRTYEHLKGDLSWTDDECAKVGHDERACTLTSCNKDCIQEISSWSECTATCGFKGTQRRTISNIVAKLDGGLDCAEENTTQSCPAIHCPVNCTYTNWTIGTCSVSCGRGTITKLRNILTKAMYNGHCDNDTKRISICEIEPCIDNCTKLNLTEKTECSVTCGTGYYSEQYIVTKKENEWGFCDNPPRNLTCETKISCDVQANSEAYEEVQGMSSQAITIIAVSVIAAIVIIAVLIAFVYVYVSRSNKSKLANRDVMHQAVKDILGKKSDKKERKQSNSSAKEMKQSKSPMKAKNRPKSPLKKNKRPKSPVKVKKTATPNVSKSIK